MPAISHRELRSDIVDVLARVAAGESFVVTNGGIAVAELRRIPGRKPVPLTPAKQSGGWSELAGRWSLTTGRTTAGLMADLQGDR